MSNEEAKELGLETPEEEEEEEAVTTTSPADKESILRALIGEGGYNTLVNVADSIGKPIFDKEDKEGKQLKGFIDMYEVDEELESIEVLQGKSRNATNFVLYTINAKGEPEEINLNSIESLQESGKGYKGYDISTLYDNTKFDEEATSEQIGESLSEVFKSKLALGNIENTQAEHKDKLKKIQNSMTVLGDVFGFDDQQHLEIFMAAWLMKDSTCRLSGIPGTGKTTVIEAASVLLCNSYGFDSKPRYVAPTNRETSLEELFGDNRSYVPDLYKQGQLYDLSYSNTAYQSVMEGWDAWRFTTWRKPGGSTRSGAYLYDFTFLEMTGKDSDGEPFSKIKMKSSDFSMLLNNCYVAQVPKEGFRHPGDTDDDGKYITGSDLLRLLPEEEITQIVAPIKLLDENGKEAAFDEAMMATVSCGNIIQRGTKDPEKFVFEMRLRYPECRFGAKTNELNYKNILKTSDGNAADYLQKDENDNPIGLFTDAGRSEGYGFRQFLQTYYYDARLKPEEASDRAIGLKQILEEMLREIGVAKIDYEKRADEVLYGIEIQQSTYDDPIRDKTVSTYEFEPVPRPIVTQPVKFFNEANRSQAGVEDAVLGLIAERKVEYRGKTFDSPHFVAWMDTNPHQKGNDLAFIDRIDMELLFKSISLGARYTVLSGTYGGVGSGLSPQLQVVNQLAITGNAPMRFNELNSVWSFIGDNSKIGFTPPGQSPGSATYDALREISYISVLFTQKWAGKNYELSVGEGGNFNIAEALSLKSPLMDYSTVTNTTDEGAIGSLPFSNFFANQPPANFGRVLGFRFTNSLVKLSSALAFLRGRSYVTRSEILDGLPYVTAHRLGRAKTAAAKDARGLASGLNFENEQQWIREAIVNGYLLSKNSTAFARGDLALMDVWDLYYRRCVDNLKSSPALFWYEAQIIGPLRTVLTASAEVAGQITPVHWHIATMVMENERTATSTSSTPSYRSYKHGDDYMTNYNFYRNRIFSKPNPDKATINLQDYFKLRGEIAQEPNLFSDDRENLLSYLESRMGTIAGTDSEKGAISNPTAIAKHKSQALNSTTRTDFGLLINPREFPWRTYQDSIGSWGRMLAMDGSSGTDQITNFANQAQQDVTGATSFTDQALMISGRMECRKPIGNKDSPTHSTLARNDFLRQITNLRTSFSSASLGEGVRIMSVAEGDFTETTLEEFMDLASALVTQYSEQDAPESNFIVNEGKPNEVDVEVATQGLIGCFPLKHAGGAPSADASYTGDYDFLRLWVRVFQSEISRPSDVSEDTSERPMATLNLTMGITSNFADTNKNMISMTGPFTKELNPYNTANFTTTPNYELKTVKPGLMDTGNLSLTDILQYQVVFDDAVTTEE